MNYICCGCLRTATQCTCVKANGQPLRDPDGNLAREYGPSVDHTNMWPDAEPPLVEGCVFSIVLAESRYNDTVMAQVYSDTERGPIFKQYVIPLKNFAWNGQAGICRDEGGKRLWFAERLGEGIYASRDRPYRSPADCLLWARRVADALVEFQAVTKPIRASTAVRGGVTMMQRLGQGVAGAAIPALYCQGRLNEQLQAGGVDSEFDRESIRRRVSAELFMVQRVTQHIRDVDDALGDNFRRTAADDGQV